MPGLRNVLDLAVGDQQEPIPEFDLSVSVLSIARQEQEEGGKLMANVNCLEGIRCPECGQEDEFDIYGECIFEVTDNGSEAAGDHEWDYTSHTECGCGHSGPLGSFYRRKKERAEAQLGLDRKARELNAILTGLRLVQHHLAGMVRFPEGIEEIFTDNGRYSGMNVEDINDLCEHLNCGGYK
jgi:hypothetical protein